MKKRAGIILCLGAAVAGVAYIATLLVEPPGKSTLTEEKKPARVVGSYDESDLPGPAILELEPKEVVIESNAPTSPPKATRK